MKIGGHRRRHGIGLADRLVPDRRTVFPLHDAGAGVDEISMRVAAAVVVRTDPRRARHARLQQPGQVAAGRTIAAAGLCCTAW